MSQTLEEYHARIEAMMAAGETVMAARDPAPEAMVKRRIGEAALLMASYQLFVHREVFLPLLDRADAGGRARIAEVKVECIALMEDLRFNMRDFLAKEGPVDWAQTTSTVKWFNDRTRRHIAAVRALMDSSSGAFTRRAGSVGLAA